MANKAHHIIQLKGPHLKVCECGCEQQFYGRRNQKYIDSSHKSKANNEKRSKELAQILNRIAHLLVNDPMKLDAIVNAFDKQKMEKISQIPELQDKNTSWIPEGYDKEGWKKFHLLQDTFVFSPHEIAEKMGLPPNIIYSLGVLFYFVFLLKIMFNVF